MEPLDQEYMDLVRQFMLALTPILARHRLSMLRHSVRNLDEDINRLTTEAASANAYQCLQWAMQLASRYRDCYHEALTTAQDK
jgi:hypothetical protein